jgi:predicted deacylase
MAKTRNLTIGGESVAPGETRDIRLKLSESYIGDPTGIFVRVIRSGKPGPTVFVTAAIHGDELNGVGIVHELMFGEPVNVTAGSLVLVPVSNAFGFETHERYLPDRRDLNRCFPGSLRGSLARRVAHTIMHGIIRQCDYGIDLHSAAQGRTNFPNVRGDMSIPGVAKIAKAFGCELIVDSKGPGGSLRREACKAGVPTIILEAGEPLKMEPTMLELGVRGVHNVFASLKMIDHPIRKPPYQATVQKTTWVRATVGGILRFNVVPGDPVRKGDPVATNFSVLGEQQNVLTSPVDGIVLGMTTLPVVKPGEPVCHLAIPTRTLSSIRRDIEKMGSRNIFQRIRRDLATNISMAPENGDEE